MTSLGRRGLQRASFSTIFVFSRLLCPPRPLSSPSLSNALDLHSNLYPRRVAAYLSPMSRFIFSSISSTDSRLGGARLAPAPADPAPPDPELVE